MKQTISVSAHADYLLKNMTNDTIMYECLRWSFKQVPPRVMCAITEVNDPNYVTAPIYTGNILNFFGACFALDAIDNTDYADARNASLLYGEYDYTMSPTFNRFVKISKFKFSLKPGRFKKFTIGRTKLELDTAEMFAPLASQVDTTASAWTYSFIPGACGLLFRQFGDMALPVGSVSLYSSLSYAQPVTVLQTTFKYTVFDWLGKPEIFDNFEIRGTIGVVANAGNSTVQTILPDSDVKSVIITANN